MENKPLIWIGVFLFVFYVFSDSKDKKNKSPPNIYTPAIDYSSKKSGIYGCTDDCSGHEAGYTWAEDHQITDPDDCSGNSQSFIEGCQEYAEDNREEQER
jgi:hypothetical protein